MKVIELKKSITKSNDEDADALRQRLKKRHTFLINVMSSAGAGKTTLLLKLIEDMSEDLKIAVIEADIDSQIDAVRIGEAGAKSLQVHTDGMCHMDAGMTEEAVEELGDEIYDLIFLENVGNLICPAEFDTGAHLKVMLLSIPEGDDKPLKYPLMFKESDALVITKTDTAGYFSFDVKECIKRVKGLNPGISIFTVSAKTGEGMREFEEWIKMKKKEEV